MEYQETGYVVYSSTYFLTPQRTPFKKEPGAVSGRILRGVLDFGGDSSNAIPFLWQHGARKLYLDLNRNQDLTDDPSSVFVADAATPLSSQTFHNVHLSFNTAYGSCQVLADLCLMQSGSQWYSTLAVHSFRQGKLMLQGREWQVGLVGDAFSRANTRLLLRPWEKRNEPFNANDGLLATVPFEQRLFVDGHAFKMEQIVGPQDGEARPALQFTEQPVTLGELKITGQFIRRIVLQGGSYMAVLDQPSGVVKIPAGNYSQADISLEQGGTSAFLGSGQPPPGGQISINDKIPAVLKTGGPLTNTVNASRHGEDLLLDYRLVGVGGETYQLAGQNRTKPPSYAVYRGTRKMASGDFEFG